MRTLLLGLGASLLLGGCALGEIIGGEPPTDCRAYADEVRGTVVASYPSTIAAIRELRAVEDNPQLAGLAEDQQATVCYVDGDIPMAPPPNAGGEVQPSFDRAVLVVIGGETVPVALGYADEIPVEAP